MNEENGVTCLWLTRKIGQSIVISPVLYEYVKVELCICYFTEIKGYSVTQFRFWKRILTALELYIHYELVKIIYGCIVMTQLDDFCHFSSFTEEKDTL